MQTNQDRFKELKKLLQLKSPDTQFRGALERLIGDCRAFKFMWSDAPRRKLVHADLKVLQTAFRRQPEHLQVHLSNLSPEETLRLNLQGLNEDTTVDEMKKIIQAAIKYTPKDTGGVPADEPLRFLVGQFARLYEEKTKLRPTLTYNAYSEQHKGRFLQCLEIAATMGWGSRPIREKLA